MAGWRQGTITRQVDGKMMIPGAYRLAGWRQGTITRQVDGKMMIPGAYSNHPDCCKLPDCKTTGLQATKQQEYRTARLHGLHTANCRNAKTAEINITAAGGG